MTAKDDLLAAIAHEHALITRLERERHDAQARVRSLQIELGAQTADSISPPVPTAAGDKIALLRDLLVRSLLGIGASTKDIAREIGRDAA